MVEKIYDKIGSVQEINGIAADLRRIGLREEIKILAEKNKIPTGDIEDYLKGKRYFLVDGGVTDILPVNLLQAAGIRDVLAVDIGGDYEAPSDRSVMEVASHSFSIMSGRLKDCASTGEVLLLKPPLSSKAGLLTFELMGECMERGYEYTRKMLPQIQKVLN